MSTCRASTIFMPFGDLRIFNACARSRGIITNSACTCAPVCASLVGMRACLFLMSAQRVCVDEDDFGRLSFLRGPGRDGACPLGLDA